ncbi:MAG: hypothetical protein J7L78_04575 [Dehalococcoidales bacterium]|nr:hypothetical protein [Dehalococcoidales bacterium]
MIYRPLGQRLGEVIEEKLTREEKQLKIEKDLWEQAFRGYEAGNSVW